MKSFFKKLAFVMALAMVVSLAAPAAAQAAPALAAAHQTSKEVVTELDMEVGDEVDLCFLGAQGGKAVWSKLNRGWKVTSGDAVTVNQDGLVKAVKDGEATIEFFMEGYENAVVTITVGAEEDVTGIYAGYDVTGVKEVTLKFNVNVDSVKEADVELYRVFDSVDGEVEVYWPIDGFSAKDGKIVVSPFVQFKDGDHYRIKYNGENYDFVAFIPEITEITHVETTFGTNAAANDKKAPQSDIEEDEEDWSVINLGYKLMSGNMDVTALYKKDVTVEYALVSPDEDTDDLDEILEIDEEDGELVIFTTDKVVVKAVVTYEIEVDDEDVEVEIPSPGVEITPTAIVPFDFDKVVDWAFYAGSGDFSWSTKTVPAGEEGYYVVLKIQDTRGGVYVTDGVAIASGDNTTKVFGTSELEKAGYSFEFYSTNTDTFLINKGVDDKKPEVKTYKAADQAVFYVELHKEDLNEDDPTDTLVDTVWAGVFEIGAPKTFSKIGLSVDSTVELMADADENDYIIKTIVGTPKHQYNNGTWEPTTGYVFKYEVKCDNSKVKMEKDTDYTVDPATGIITITVDASKIFAKTEKDGNYKFTIKESTSGITETFTVAIEEPNFNDDGSIDYDSKKGYSTDIEFPTIKLKTTGNQQAWIEGVDTLTNLPEKKFATIEFLMTSGGHTVGHHSVNSAWTIADTADWKDATGTYEEGDRIVVVKKDGEIVKRDTTTGLYTMNLTSNGLAIQLAANTANGVVYAESGTYTVEVHTVIRLKDDKVYKTVETEATFRYLGNLKDVKLVDRVAVKTTLDVDNAANWSDIVADSFKFTLGGSEWKLGADANGADCIVVDAKDVVVDENNYIIIKKITVKVPVDYKTNHDATQSYYTRVLDVNMSVEHVAE